MSLLRRWWRHAPHTQAKLRSHLHLEALESRVVPYSLTGTAWPHPQFVTISIVPDGTDIGGARSNLNAAFARMGPGWVNQILSAAQYWAPQTNLNFQLVPDYGRSPQQSSYQQGDPYAGDIRIGGYDFGTSTVLARAFFPPPLNNFSIAGDIQFNTRQVFNIGATYDLFTVAVHEFGHALGLGPSQAWDSVMWEGYRTIRRALSADDIAGIRAVYSRYDVRSYDSFRGTNSSLGTAADVTWMTDPVRKTVLLTWRDITYPWQQEFYRVVVPQGTNGSMTVKVQSYGLSLLSPYVTVYNGVGQAIAADGWSGRTATVLSVTVNGVTAGQPYYVRVTGADSSAFSVGAYALTFAFSSYSVSVPLPDTRVWNGSPLRGSSFDYEESTPGRGSDEQFSASFGTVSTDDANVEPQPTNDNPAAVAILLQISISQFGTTFEQNSACFDRILAAPLPLGQTISDLLTPYAVVAERWAMGTRAESVVEETGPVANTEPMEELPAASATAELRTAQPPVLAKPTAEATHSSAAWWRAACSACIAEDRILWSLREGLGGTSDRGNVDGASVEREPAAAALALTVVLGSYWATGGDRPGARKFIRRQRLPSAR